MMVSVAAVVVIGLALFAQGIMDVHTDMHNKYVLFYILFPVQLTYHVEAYEAMYVHY